MTSPWSARFKVRAYLLCLLAASLTACGGSGGAQSASSASTESGDSTTSAPEPFSVTSGTSATDDAMADERRQSLIVGGAQASQSYPFTAALLTAGGQQFCGGTLIDAQWVVTAAHCAIPELHAVRLGSNNSTQGGQVVTVTRSIRHPDYNDNNIALGRDIALLKLSQPVSGIAPAAIGRAAPAVGSTVRLLGWGQTTPVQGDNSASPTLKELDSPIVDLANCGDTQAGDLCVGSTPQATSCFGDSGGPALSDQGGQWTLVGATSRAMGTTCGNDTIYTDVAYFRDWMAQTQASADDGGTPPNAGGDVACEGCTRFEDSLSGPNTGVVYPQSGYFYQAGGILSAQLAGPSGATFDVELYRWSGTRWRRVARQSSVNGSTAAVTYNGRAGYYAWQVISRQGAGAYRVAVTLP